jgi:hypothetical protein
MPYSHGLASAYAGSYRSRRLNAARNVSATTSSAILGAYPPGDVPVDHLGMPVKQFGERLRIGH